MCVRVSVCLSLRHQFLRRSITLLTHFVQIFLFNFLGRYSPVRRASEGSRCQMLSHGPFQECQQLQKGLAHKNLLVAQTSPVDTNATSLPGELIRVRGSYISYKII